MAKSGSRQQGGSAIRDNHQRNHQQRSRPSLPSPFPRLAKMWLKDRHLRRRHAELIREMHCRPLPGNHIGCHYHALHGGARHDLSKGKPSPSTHKAGPCGMGHCVFLNRLQVKCRDVGTTLLVQPEAYTSKTCPSCGTLSQRLGSKKVIAQPAPIVLIETTMVRSR